MIRFKPRISGVGSNWSTKCATTTGKRGHISLLLKGSGCSRAGRAIAPTAEDPDSNLFINKFIFIYSKKFQTVKKEKMLLHKIS